MEDKDNPAMVNEKKLVADEEYRGIRYQIYEIFMPEFEEARKMLKKELKRTPSLRSRWVVLEHEPDPKVDDMINLAIVGSSWDNKEEFLYSDTAGLSGDGLTIEQQVEVMRRRARYDIDDLLNAIKVKE